MSGELEERKEGAVAVNSPDALIMFALEKGADLDKLEKLMIIKREHEKDEARKAYHKAMAEFKANPPKIDKDKKVGYSTSKGNVGYSHASLANVVEKITTELSKHGLSASWRTQQNGKVIVTCKITHILGHSEETPLSADADMSGSKNSIQAIGSTITYLERYSLLAILGLATKDQDDDAQAATVYITEEQVHSIRDKLIAYGKEKQEGVLLKYLKVDKLELLPAKDFKKAMIAIEVGQKK